MKKLSLQYRMMLYSTTMIIVVVSLLASILLYYHNVDVWEEFDIRINSLAADLSHDLRFENEEEIKRVFTGVLKLQDVISVSVFDKTGKGLIVMGRSPSSVPERFLKTIRSDIVMTPEDMLKHGEDILPIDAVEIVYSTLRMRYEFIRIINVIIFFTTIIIFLRVLSDYLFTRGITIPLRKLVNGADAVADGDLTQTIDIPSGLELGMLASSFNKMTVALKKRDKEIMSNQEKLQKHFTELEISHNELDNAYKKLNEKTGEIEEYKGVLEDRVKERTGELEKTNRQLADSYEKIKEVDRIKSEFLSNMSHELRTPLNSIIGFSRVILKGIDGQITDAQKKDMNVIYNSGQHLLTLINDVLDLSKIEAGKMELVLEDIDIRKLITRVVSTFDVILKEKGLKITINTETGISSTKADRTRIRQVLLNIINNAIKFTSKGTITINTRRINKEDILTIERNPYSYCPKRSPIEDGNMIMISIKDTGEGIKYEDMPKIFETFHQIDSSSTRKEGGTGLGMSITHKIVEMHGGEIWVESIAGVGSTFHFILPFKEHIVVENEDYSADVQSVPPVDGYKGLVAVIEDEIEAINLYKRILTKEGYNVVGIHTPERAVTEIISLKPDIIILDILMPKKDGWEIIQELKSNQTTKHIPVIFCTILSDKKLGMSLGATEYLIKPVSDDDLLRALTALNGTVKNIVVIDDDPKSVELIGRFLNSYGYKSIPAYGGKEGLAAIRKYMPELVIVDLMMPEVDGFCVINELKNDPATKNIPIIVLSAKDITTEDRERLNGHVEKLLKKGLSTEEELMNNVIETLKKIKK
ncbi:MAG: response regulator [Thermodesulfobacteriota bacterium]